ncbi:MAG: hypothetical protein E6K65_01750 [Nitrospirae bacterium]|nr:MAG: hypothetical protein E6K65_01750 [Nitrospirota bacterium]
MQQNENDHFLHMNPLRSPLDDLFARLALINGLLHTFESQQTNFRSLVTASLERNRFDLTNLATGANLIIRDLTEWPAHGWAGYYPAGGFIAEGEEYLNLIEVFVQRQSAWSIAQSYEAFETFLFDSTANVMANDKRGESPRRLHMENSEDGNLVPMDLEGWKVKIRQTYRSKNNCKLLKAIRTMAPNLEQAEVANNRRLNLRDWYKVITEVRHAVTHSDLLDKNARKNGWSVKEKSLLQSIVAGKLNVDGYALAPSQKNAEKTIQSFAEYSLAIFKSFSIECGYDWSKAVKGYG